MPRVMPELTAVCFTFYEFCTIVCGGSWYSLVLFGPGDIF
jgi:hypothetical protein